MRGEKMTPRYACYAAGLCINTNGILRACQWAWSHRMLHESQVVDRMTGEVVFRATICTKRPRSLDDLEQLGVEVY